MICTKKFELEEFQEYDKWKKEVLSLGAAKKEWEK